MPERAERPLWRVRRKKIRGILAGGLFVSLKYLKNVKNNYRNFCLLYKLRSNFPIYQNKEENIKAIEDFFIKISKELIENINVKDEKFLKEFTNLVKGAVKNQDEFEFLLNKIIENIDIKKKRKLWEISGL